MTNLERGGSEKKSSVDLARYRADLTAEKLLQKIEITPQDPKSLFLR